MKNLSLKPISIFVTALVVVFAILILNRSSNVLTKLDDEDDSVHVNISIQEPKIVYGMVVDDYLLIEDKIKRNQLLGDILTEYNV
ncbi:MAG TPA: hypothetical protein VFW11_18130, partial [Cyclobacteriaceae bacterium]|nr:hypothetical protein [Cyclobacteriaceae bacterium]